MREMKDSGVISIGLIPVNWSVRKFKTLAKLCNGREVNVDEGCVPVYGSGGIFKWTNIPLHSGESLLMGRKGTIDNPMLVKGEFWTVDTMFYTSEFYDIKGKFLYYCCKGTINYGYYKSGSVLPSMTQMEINNVFLPYTTSLEQDKIVNVLDKKCAQIDALIANQQTQIEKLKAYKQSLITEVVTKGLDPDVPMKDSGVEWIGMIPEHWENKRGKALFQEIETRSNDGSEELLTVSQYTGITPRSQKNVTMFEALSLEGYKVCEIGDIAANTMWLWAGAIGVSEYRGVISPSYNVYRQRHNNFIPKYLDLLLRAPMLVQEYASLSTGIRTSRLRLYPNDFFNIHFPVPPITEQQAIIKALDNKFSSVGTLITLKQAKIEKLEQYKKSLIYEYVTGKREVM